MTEVEAKTTDEVGSVIRLLFEKNIKSAPIVHKFGDAHNNQCFSEFIGLLDLDTTILWFLQVIRKLGKLPNCKCEVDCKISMLS